jgi:transposase-like protein
MNSEIILLTVRWYLNYSLSYRDLVEMMEERGLQLIHTTIMRWVHEFGPELEKRIRPYLILKYHVKECATSSLESVDREKVLKDL